MVKLKPLRRSKGNDELFLSEMRLKKAFLSISPNPCSLGKHCVQRPNMDNRLQYSLIIFNLGIFSI